MPQQCCTTLKLAYNTAAFNLGNLSHQGAHSSCSSIHHQRLPGLRLTNLKESKICCGPEITWEKKKKKPRPQALHKKKVEPGGVASILVSLLTFASRV